MPCTRFTSVMKIVLTRGLCNFSVIILEIPRLILILTRRSFFPCADVFEDEYERE